ncbi:hypothetical protein [uncultured Endozoicomonas sp.]|uniref:hypothetical protein n=1 Tax=uncultured Endozoicomonas sp. TaxID=432652 RepID=UPI0026187535|nr:hypothetical protein [uncultured Endozoicomonas sp.]
MSEARFGNRSVIQLSDGYIESMRPYAEVKLLVTEEERQVVIIKKPKTQVTKVSAVIEGTEPKDDKGEVVRMDGNNLKYQTRLCSKTKIWKSLDKEFKKTRNSNGDKKMSPVLKHITGMSAQNMSETRMIVFLLIKYFQQKKIVIDEMETACKALANKYIKDSIAQKIAAYEAMKNIESDFSKTSLNLCYLENVVYFATAIAEQNSMDGTEIAIGVHRSAIPLDKYGVNLINFGEVNEEMKRSLVREMRGVLKRYVDEGTSNGLLTIGCEIVSSLRKLLQREMTAFCLRIVREKAERVDNVTCKDKSIEEDRDNMILRARTLQAQIYTEISEVLKLNGANYYIKLEPVEDVIAKAITDYEAAHRQLMDTDAVISTAPGTLV